jgi:hypothetical protein
MFTFFRFSCSLALKSIVKRRTSSTSSIFYRNHSSSKLNSGTLVCAHHGKPGVQERNLDVSIQELLTAERSFTYADLYAMLGNKYAVLWLTPCIAVARAGGLANRYSAVSSSEELLEICDVVLLLLAASVVHSVELSNWICSGDDVSINATSLEFLMDQCQSLCTTLGSRTKIKSVCLAPIRDQTSR